MDEARIGLQPIRHKTWAPLGVRPTVEVAPKYEWRYVYSAVQPLTGKTYTLILPSVNTDMMQIWLDSFAASRPRNTTSLVVLDGAGWHTTSKLTVHRNIETIALPPYSPELNPAERLWTLMRRCLANRYFASLNELDEAIINAVRNWIRDTGALASLTSYQWIRKVNRLIQN